MDTLNDIQTLEIIAVDIDKAQRWINQAEIKRAEHIALHGLYSWQHHDLSEQLDSMKEGIETLKKRFNNQLSKINPYILTKKPNYVPTTPANR